MPNVIKVDFPVYFEVLSAHVLAVFLSSESFIIAIMTDFFSFSFYLQILIISNPLDSCKK